jgi:hypothetical protein
MAVATTAAAGRTIFPGTGLIYRDGAPVQLHAVEGVHGVLGFFEVIHRDKGEAFGPTGEFVGDELHAIHGAVGTEGIMKGGFVRIVGQIADVDFHVLLFLPLVLLHNLVRGETGLSAPPPANLSGLEVKLWVVLTTPHP